MNTHLRLLVACGLLLPINSNLQAQESKSAINDIYAEKTAEGAKSNKLEHLRVTDQISDNRNSLTEVSLEAYTGFVRLIDRSDFDARFVDFSNLLDTLPGIQVSQSGGTGTFSTLSVRGSSGKQVNIFLDGLLLNSPNSGSASISQIPSVLIERVEAYPDFTPAQLGNANLAGAINFKSRNFETAQPGARLSVSNGSFGLLSAELSAWGNVSDWNILGGISQVETDNDFPVEDEFFRTASKRRINDGYQQENGFLKLGKKWQGGQFSSFFQKSNSEKELPTTLNQLRDNATLTNDSWRIQAVLDYQLNQVDLAHRFFIHQDEDTYLDPNSTVGLGIDHKETQLDGLGLFSTARYIVGQHELVASLEWRHDEVEQKDKLNQQDTIQAERETFILALADSWCINEQWLVTATARQYRVEDKADFLLRNATTSDTSDESSFHLGAQWRISSNLTAKANTGLLVRIPTLAEKFGSRGLFEGNSDLQSETARTLDSGITLQLSRFQLDASVFYREIDDGIVTIFDSRGVGQPQNIAASEVFGIESQANFTLNNWLQLRANATLFDSKNQSDIRSSQGKKLPGIYHQSAGAGVVIVHKNTRAQIHYQHHSELYYDSANGVEADTKKELNASLTLDYGKVTLDLTARNLLDENFLDLNRFPTPGKSYVFTFTLEI
ncbi:TonB-dependent receptor [Spongiibacter sp. KMU-158]|uniref:TonB-dependent receptor n=1 Tax=Spongiibacter pelagi TaxID=2760804 RepID=A0A927C0W4_9GAMM|nr:TonB-dependent receptor [Spongiibacter pelagi]MBD2858684.1 TonB-dependent receptor [Spongiibacter pelagi]